VTTLTITLTVEQILELAQQLSPQERQVLIDGLLAQRFDVVLAQSDQKRQGQSIVSDEQIQAEVDSVRRQRHEDRQRAMG
jgi:hypothetical protein